MRQYFVVPQYRNDVAVIIWDERSKVGNPIESTVGLRQEGRPKCKVLTLLQQKV